MREEKKPRYVSKKINAPTVIPMKKKPNYLVPPQPKPLLTLLDLDEKDSLRSITLSPKSLQSL